MEYYIDKPDELIKKIVNAAFPYYRGRKFKISTEVPSNLDSYWQGGSKDTYKFYSLTDGKILEVGTNHPFFEANKPRTLRELPPNILLVKHCYFCGEDLGITIYVRNDNLTKLIPENVEANNITRDEAIVLQYTYGLKPCYAGISNYRLHNALKNGIITEERWYKALNSLIERKLLRKNKSITPNGMNALKNYPEKIKMY